MEISSFNRRNLRRRSARLDRQSKERRRARHKLGSGHLQQHCPRIPQCYIKFTYHHRPLRPIGSRIQFRQSIFSVFLSPRNEFTNSSNCTGRLVARVFGKFSRERFGNQNRTNDATFIRRDVSRRGKGIRFPFKTNG